MYRSIWLFIVILLGGISPVPAADDVAVCANAAGDNAIAACSRIIESGQTSGQELAVVYRRRGVALRTKGNNDRAIVDFDAAIQIDPKYVSALVDRGVAWRNTGDLDRAIADFDAAIKLDTKNASAFFHRAFTWGRKGEVDRAIADYSESIRLDPKSAMAFHNRGIHWRAKGDLDRAISDFDEAVRLNGKYVSAYNYRGLSYADKNQYDRAISDFNTAINIDSKYAFALANRGEVSRKKGDLDRAISDFDEAVRLDPKNVVAYTSRGLSYFDKGQYDRAIADFDLVILINREDVYAYNMRGRGWKAKGDLDRAIADYNEAIRLNPKYSLAYINRGNVWKDKGDNDRAIADYDEAIRLDPKNPHPYSNRGIIWRAKHDFDRAITDYNEAVRLDPNYSAAITGLGLAYESKGEPDRARAYFQRAVALPPKYENGKWAQDTARARLPLQSLPRTPSAVTPPPSLANGNNRLALVIGNGAYINTQYLPKLANPPNDARAVARALREIGFTVIDATDLDHTGMEQTIVDFLHKVPLVSIAVVFYAGHGVQIDGKNYLVPIDATSLTRSAAKFELIDVDRILASLDDQARANIIILDACRNTPVESNVVTRSGTRGGGLAGYSTVASGMLVAFATAPGMTAVDGTGPNSPFTNALVKHIVTPDLEINQMFNRVRKDVVEATNRQQIPWTNSSLLGDLVLPARGSIAAPPISQSQH